MNNYLHDALRDQFISSSRYCIMFGFRRSKERVYSLDEIAERVRPVAEQYEVDSIYVFGSYGRGEAQPDSDIDLLVSADKVQGIAIGGLFLDLKEALGKEIDMVTDKSDPRFIAMIRKDAVRVYG